MSEHLTILVADDNPSDRLLLQSMLSRFGHKVVCAEDGQEAIDFFDPDVIQLVCLDIRMPRKNGWEAALEIQALATDKLVPIVFLSGVTDTDALENCLRVGGTDFISKPYNPMLVTAKLNAIARLLMLQNTLFVQRDELTVLNQQMVHDQEIAKIVYERITHSNCLSDPMLNVLHHGSHIFNGDVVLAAYKPNGGMHILLGDFTGHGLSAAIGALPLADIFFDWTEKGFVMRQILPEVNRRLFEILPPNMFCAAAFIDLNINDQTLEVWNGGLPDVLFFSTESSAPQRIQSSSLPLGVLNGREFECDTEIITYNENDYLIAFSDGVYEAKTGAGKVKYNDALDPLYAGDVVHGQQFNWLTDMLRSEGILDNPHDDISCLAIDLSKLPRDNGQDGGMREAAGGNNRPACFSFQYDLDAESLRTSDPLPYLLQILNTVDGLNRHSSQVFMILTEMYSNALEHGILRLESSKKRTVDGFSEYYAERELRLQNLNEGRISIKVEVVANAEEGKLVLTVSDSGEGFDISKINLDVFDSDKPFNRGLALIHQLCTSVTFGDHGNSMEAVYRWKN
ncbi:response regulator [Maribrevibacterium harenarium]|uniref:Response regulator n=1 Tax=Maribrevibacterium harenarium TaxID=2589817 RepID=A0A501X2M8_9GAMM|nr:SpoIIE family protein phosphatase [Maribrevibacterium harenarium]TPE54703.1 response regulator [Maribrevibacterium harenarium]